MTSEQKIQAATDLKANSPLVVAPLIIGYAARCASMSQAQLYEDPRNWLLALQSTFERIGTPDAVFPLWPRDAALSQMLRVKLPGRDLDGEDQVQFIEEEVMSREDYDIIINHGYQDWFMDYWCRVRDGVPGGLAGKARTIRGFMKQGLRIRRNVRRLDKLGIAPMFSAACYPPFDLFSLLRSLSPFCYDLTDCADKVLSASDAALPTIIKMASIPLRLTHGKRICVYPMRSSSTFISEQMFLKYSFPYLKRIVEAFAERGTISVIHCDGNWNPFLRHFRGLPRGSCIIELDGDTDIFRAKQVLGDWLCLKGNVPASMLAFGRVEEVSEYCEKLISEVGKEGGFILSSGCEVPLNAELENVRAMMEAAARRRAG